MNEIQDGLWDEAQDSPNQGLEPASEDATDVLPSGEPQEFGFPQGYVPQKKVEMWQKQEAFLAQYRQFGRVGKSAKAVGLTRWAVDYWNRVDVFSFRERIKAAHADYVEDVIEANIDDRLENPIKGVQGSDVLAIFRAKAEAPEKYREVITVEDDTPLKVMEMLKRMAAESPRVIQSQQTDRAVEVKALEGGEQE